jgi:hypothetical protein
MPQAQCHAGADCLWGGRLEVSIVSEVMIVSVWGHGCERIFHFSIDFLNGYGYTAYYVTVGQGDVNAPTLSMYVIAPVAGGPSCS